MEPLKEDNGPASDSDPPIVKESTIRKMTRLAAEYNAVNLSQGFPNEPPPMSVRVALAWAVLQGVPAAPHNCINGNQEEEDVHSQALLQSLTNNHKSDTNDNSNHNDILNQYSPPMGRSDVRNAIANYYQRLYDFRVDSENCITVTLGATEAMASALRTLGRPGDKVVVLEPYHELYAAQCRLFYLEPVFVTLRANPDQQRWEYDPSELEAALAQQRTRIVILNTPHNPTGKVFTPEELEQIVNLCLKHNVYIVTDEIYEHMIFPREAGNAKNSPQHILIPHQHPQVKHLCLVCNSMGKSASATGWRLGWCLHPPHLSDTYRGIHDQMAVMSPHPMQYASLTYLSLPMTYFKDLRCRYEERVKLLATTLSKLGFEVVMPEGAYYLFVKYRLVPSLAKFATPTQAAEHLLKQARVACVPGDNFYGSELGQTKEGNEYLRFAACRSIADIREACTRLMKHLG